MGENIISDVHARILGGMKRCRNERLNGGQLAILRFGGAWWDKIMEIDTISAKTSLTRSGNRNQWGVPTFSSYNLIYLAGEAGFCLQILKSLPTLR
jgi:hypothetical protein